MDDEVEAEANPQNAQGRAADVARNDRRERGEDGMSEILRQRGKWKLETPLVYCARAKPWVWNPVAS